MRILIEDLERLYEEQRTGEARAPLEPAAQYSDFVRWQNDLLSGPRGQELWSYWREALSGEPPLRFEVRSLTSEAALREIRTGRIDMAIIRTEAITEDLQSELIAPIQHIFAVPRTLLRTKEGAEVFEGRPIPFAELGSDPFFAKTARTTAAALGLHLHTIIQAESFSLLMSAVETGTAAAFLPTIAARSLPEQHFAQVSAEQMREMNRSLSLVWYGKSAESRASVRRALTRLKRALA